MRPDTDFFDYLDSGLDAEDPARRIQQARAAFRQARRDGVDLSGAAARWTRALVRFCDFDALADWVHRRPRTLRRIASWAMREGHDGVASMIDQALTRATGSAPDTLDFGDLEAQLSLLMEPFARTVLAYLQDARGDFPLPLPAGLRRRWPEVG